MNSFYNKTPFCFSAFCHDKDNGFFNYQVPKNFWYSFYPAENDEILRHTELPDHTDPAECGFGILSLNCSTSDANKLRLPLAMCLTVCLIILLKVNIKVNKFPSLIFSTRIAMDRFFVHLSLNLYWAKSLQMSFVDVIRS